MHKIALKILKKECRANAEVCAKLEREARITASIDHPHVIKVFSFGEDQGQFYLAMELAEKGSLVDLMSVKPRLAEAQVLQVGIQIAKGLDAALEHNLIHRDIKPGNILFSDPDTAKLVDFGLAIFMDEVAHAETWGTAYYIAPEKMDDRPDRPEDFRSDIYSLGGTLFHALAGRPPHTGGGVITVALKQLMSQPVSLQTFAPDVSSETAYVINRMLAKDPDQRYGSYQELIEHLSHAHRKVLERSQQPQKLKERVVLESQSSKTLSGLLSLGLLAILIASCILIFGFGKTLFEPAGSASTPSPRAEHSSEVSKRMFLQAVQLLAGRQADKALPAFDRLLALEPVEQPMKNWIRMNGALAALVAGDRKEAVRRFQEIENDGSYSVEESEQLLASFFVEASKQLAKSKPIPSPIARLYSNASFESFGILCFALHDWNAGAFEDAGSLFDSFVNAQVPEAQSWIEAYKPLAKAYYADCRLVAPLESELSRATDKASAEVLAEKVRRTRESLRVGGKALSRLEAIERQLIAKGASS